MLSQQAGRAKFAADQSHLYSGRFCLSFEIWIASGLRKACSMYMWSLTFYAISDIVPVIHSRAETTISMLRLSLLGITRKFLQRIVSTALCLQLSASAASRELQMVMHFTTSPTSRLQTFPIYIRESSCNILSDTATRDTSKHSWNTVTHN